VDLLPMKMRTPLDGLLKSNINRLLARSRQEGED